MIQKWMNPSKLLYSSSNARKWLFTASTLFTHTECSVASVDLQSRGDGNRLCRCRVHKNNSSRKSNASNHKPNNQIGHFICAIIRSQCICLLDHLPLKYKNNVYISTVVCKQSMLLLNIFGVFGQLRRHGLCVVQQQAKQTRDHHRRPLSVIAMAPSIGLNALG